MFLFPFLCILSTTLARHTGNSYYGYGLRSEDDMKHLYNNNFSEDELIAINNYKSGNAPYFKATDNIFDESLFDNRRMFGWVSKLLRKNKNKTSTQQPRYEDLINEKLFYLNLSRNLSDNLTKLTNVLDHFTKSIKEKPLLRVSRSVDDAQNETDLNENTDTINSTDKTNDTDTDNNTSDSYNRTEIVDKTEEPNEPIDGRRSFKSVELEHKLLSAINDTLNVIQYKIQTVSNIQELFSDRLMYKVGYIAGSLTAIKGLIDEIHLNVVKNDTQLDDKYILNMYDTVNRIKESSGRLLELLNVYVDKATSELIANK
ncbi:uncharacterized protein LOC123704518 [Colias croceus]|uniref:uncharacterized protein LOC123704518 n=1 Tax=Colias crocea TaxID=72248 RepID=UPI001E27DF20|nr:uncharacterized protein LOC123704518 [Colias croceus]